MTASRLLTIAVQLQLLSAERSSTDQEGWRESSACLQSAGNLLVTGLMDKTSCSHKWPHGFCCIHGCVGFHLVSPSWRRHQWLVCSQEGKGSSLISRLIHIPSELRRIEVCMWRIIINTQAVSPSHESSRTLHNCTAKGGSNQTWDAERQPGRPWPRHKIHTY